MTVGASRCPLCGGPVEPKPDPAPCAHCGAVLHPLRCPWCFDWSFRESKDCPRCGASAPPPGPPGDCPDGHGPLCARERAGVRLAGCGACGGVWTDAASFRRLCEDREASTAFSVAEGAPRANPLSRPVRYRPCPACGELMNRLNFAASSGVVVDVCKGHGTWLDAGELADIVAFIRGGGLDAARARELERLEAERRKLAAEEAEARRLGQPPGSRLPSFESWAIGLTLGELKGRIEETGP